MRTHTLTWTTYGRLMSKSLKPNVCANPSCCKICKRRSCRRRSESTHILFGLQHVFFSPRFSDKKRTLSLNPLPNNPRLLTTLSKKKKKHLKTLWKKKKMLVTSISSFSHNVFNTIKDKNHHFKYFNFVVCRCFQFGPV